MEVWNYFGAFADNNYDILRKIYTSYKEDSVSKAELKELVRKFVLLRINEIQMGIPQHLSIDKKLLSINWGNQYIQN